MITKSAFFGVPENSKNGRRRSSQKQEEQRMRMAREADWLAATTSQLIQR